MDEQKDWPVPRLHWDRAMKPALYSLSGLITRMEP